MASAASEWNGIKADISPLCSDSAAVAAQTRKFTLSNLAGRPELEFELDGKSGFVVLGIMPHLVHAESRDAGLG